jgi:uncharacterized protein (DUF1330 family)
MAAYVIYQAQVTDPEQYARYREKSTSAVVNAGVNVANHQMPKAA